MMNQPVQIILELNLTPITNPIPAESNIADRTFHLSENNIDVSMHTKVNAEPNAIGILDLYGHCYEILIDSGSLFWGSIRDRVAGNSLPPIFRPLGSVFAGFVNESAECSPDLRS